MSSSVAGPDCCGGFGNVDFRQADLCVMTRLLGYVDPSDPCFVAAILTITFNPLFWNVAQTCPFFLTKGGGVCSSPSKSLGLLEYPGGEHGTHMGPGEAQKPLLSRKACTLLPVPTPSHPAWAGCHQQGVTRYQPPVLEVARWEQRTRKLSKVFRSPYLACYSLGAAILLLNVLRSHCFTQAMLSQPKMESLDNPTAYRVGLALLGIGSTFVLSSFFALGFTGTFLGDYFGILMEARVTTFPFNILDNPMYWGSTANYLGWAIMHASPTGLLLTVVVALIYMVAIQYEEPFTAQIYQQKASSSRKRS
ncbi:phosphatidylethanolamine N-methyltransferase isoform X3 [Acinonyx jubatus]|uniref:Phosphatidylethanolamine N-methyltransferase n=1 Tax=Acinonyx jubatus TaxID=32536 RepID=A0ABM3P7K4_ACIJB|nr:phosphatidylethanolamine N-methyltransferase isoform X3 [Acinonyx jubatus]